MDVSLQTGYYFEVPTSLKCFILYFRIPLNFVPLLLFRASKTFGIPNSTLYKIARKEGIKLSSPFSAIQPSWNPEDLSRALDAIRGGLSVQKSATEFGIPTGTLYGRCRREGIELSKYQVRLQFYHCFMNICKYL